MKKLLLSLVAALALPVFFSNAVSAEYLAEEDQTISVETGLELEPLPLDTADLTFNLQETVHTELTDTTGVEVDHYYYWISVDNQPVLAIDPARVMY